MHSLVDLGLRNSKAAFSTDVALQHMLSRWRGGHISMPHALHAVDRKALGVLACGVGNSHAEESR